ncbi:MAG: sugar ABC transporter ATP-binding protein [Actinomycetota bacterium]|nr:sugar ABC transporter ATP-binding protein [Actinomycetota bacterium]
MAHTSHLTSPSATAGADQPSLLADGVSKHFGGTAALTDATLRVRRGTVHALIGGNGSGKSTLIKILAGVHAADRGTIDVHGITWSAADPDPQRARAAGLRFVHQDLGLVDELTVAENVALDDGFPTTRWGRVRWRRLHDDVADLLARFEIGAAPDQPVGTLRPAARTMVAIARASRDEDGDVVLVLDEPTASLPHHESDLLLDYVRGRAARGQTIVVVSHRLGEVLAVADDVTALRDGRVAGTVVDRATDEDELVELIAGRAVDRGRRSTGHPVGDPVLQVEGLRSGAVRDLDLTVRSGEIVGLAGLQGSGRSSVLRALFGTSSSVGGAMLLDGAAYAPRDVADAMGRGVVLVPEDRLADAAFADLSVCDNVSAAVVRRYWRGWLRRDEQRRDTDELVDRYAIRAAGSTALFSTLSGGNQQKAVLARWLRRRPRLVLLDEPTQGVDVVARSDIYDTIREVARSGAAVLVASSDLEELETLCDRVVVLRGGRIAGELAAWEATPDRLTHLAQVVTTSTSDGSTP